MSDTSRQGDWTKPAAMAIPKGGFFKDKVEQGRYGPIFPKTPACYGFSIIAKIIPGSEERFYEYARNIEKAVAGQPDCLAVLKLHYLRWVLFPSKGTPISCTRASLIPTLTNTPRMQWPYSGQPDSRRSSKTSKASPRTGRPMRQHSSSSSVNTSVQAFWNTASTRM